MRFGGLERHQREKQRFRHRAFLQFTEEDFGQRCRGRRKKRDVKQLVKLWVCGGVQTELLVIDPNYRLVEHDLIR